MSESLHLEDEIDELILELGLRYVRTENSRSGKLLRFRIVDRDKTKQADARDIATAVLQLLLSSQAKNVVALAQDAIGVVIE